MNISADSSSALTLAAVAAGVFVLGFIIRVRGPEGFVHGVLDWNRLSGEDKRSAGRFTGLILYGMSFVLLMVATLRYSFGPRIPRSTEFDLVVPIALLALTLILVAGLLAYRKRYRDPVKNQHER